MDARFSGINVQKVTGQRHLRVRSDSIVNVAKTLYGCFGGTNDILCVIIGKIGIIYCGESPNWDRL